MELSELLENYVSIHPLKEDSVYQMRNPINGYSKFLGRQATLNDLQPLQFNRWLMSLENAGLSNETIRSKRRALMVLWRFAFDDGLADPPRKIRKVKPKALNPEIWSLEEIARLREVCKNLDGNISGFPIPRSIFWLSLANTLYDTALRIGDARRLERAWIPANGVLSIVQAKVDRVHRVRVRPETLGQIDQCMSYFPQRRLIWPAYIERRSFCRAFKRLTVLAGLTGSAKYLRRSSATYIERDNPGRGWRHLGHSRPGVDAHYIRTVVAYPDVPLPPLK